MEESSRDISSPRLADWLFGATVSIETGDRHGSPFYARLNPATKHPPLFGVSE